jgi:metallophosphoesterase (TIGR00282 family)
MYLLGPRDIRPGTINNEDFMLNILFIGDINGRPGRAAVRALLPGLIKEKKIDFTVANCENASGGFGINHESYRELLSCGINAVTMGNHTWDNKEIYKFIDSEPNLIRPANLPAGNPGRGFGVFPIDGKSSKIGVINLTGRVFMQPVEDPFRTAEKIVNEIRVSTPVIIVDMHAEATSEKQAMGFFLDGKVSLVAGTHTHVQTSDERIFSGGTAFITDTGMTGPFDSVIGVEKDIILRRFLTFMPEKFEIAKGDVHLNAVAVSVDEASGRAVKIERLDIKHEQA